MEQLINEVREFAKRSGVKPATVLQRAAGFSGKRWGEWLNGAACSLTTADKIRAYIATKSAPPPAE